jgi:hypothetical protein
VDRFCCRDASLANSCEVLWTLFSNQNWNRFQSGLAYPAAEFFVCQLRGFTKNSGIYIGTRIPLKVLYIAGQSAVFTDIDLRPK